MKNTRTSGMHRLLAMLMALGSRSHPTVMPVGYANRDTVKIPMPALHSGERQAGSGRWPFRGKNKAQRARLQAAFGSMM